MVQGLVPDASKPDLQHFRVMMDLDGSNSVSLQEFLSTLLNNADMHAKVNRKLSWHTCVKDVMLAIYTPHHLARTSCF